MRLVRETSDSKVASFRRMDEEEKFDNSVKFTEKSSPFFVSLSLLTIFDLSCQISIENCNMVTERTYDSAVFKIFLNIIVICIFIEQ